MGKLMITAIAIAATPAVVAAQTPERWFATGTLPGSSNVIGPFRTLGACDEARHEASVNSHAVAVEFALQAGVIYDYIHSHQNRGYEQDLDETRRADTLRALSTESLVTADFWKNHSLCGKR
jgi:hypothetical protein